MTYPEFIIAIEEYYGQYKNDFVRKMIKEFIIKNFSENQLPDIFKTIISKYSNKFKTPPDIAEIRMATNQSTIQAEKYWYRLLKKSGADDVLITNKVLFNVVKSWGSWDNFCIQRDGKYRELTHIEFVKKYILMSATSDLLEPEILKGASTLLYGDITSIGGVKQIRPPKIIGDIEQGLKMLEKFNGNKLEIENVVNGVFKNISEIDGGK